MTSLKKLINTSTITAVRNGFLLISIMLEEKKNHRSLIRDEDVDCDHCEDFEEDCFCLIAHFYFSNSITT